MTEPDTGANVGHAAEAGAARDPSDQARLRQLADELGRLIGPEATFVSALIARPGSAGSLRAYHSRRVLWPGQ
jgi:hypothetical protein